MLNIDDRLIKEVMPEIGPNAFATLMAISIHLNTKAGACFPSHERLMKLTRLGRDAVYSSLNTLKRHDLLKSEQSKDVQNHTFGRRQFKVTTRFISIFVCAEDTAPLLEQDEYEEKPLPENPYTENQEITPKNDPLPDFPYTANTEAYLINNILLEEEEEERAKPEISGSKQKKTERKDIPRAAAAPAPPAETPHWATTNTTTYNPGTIQDWRARLEEEANDITTYQGWGMALANLGVKITSQDDLKARIADFEIHRTTSGVTYHRESDYRQHFKNWASKRRQIETTPQQPARPNNYRQNQPAPAPQPRQYKGPVYGQ